MTFQESVLRLGRVQHRLALEARRRVSRAWLRRRHGLQTIDDVRRDASFLDMRRSVVSAGTDSIAHFGSDYAMEGGLFLQQNPDEFASLCVLLKGHRPIETYLEIGSASGGSCRFIATNVGVGRAISLDDGQHPRAAEQAGNFGHVSNFTQFRGDSHSDAARRFLAQAITTPIDVAFIDGDHSYEGVWADIRLVLGFSRPGTIFILHDTVACEGVERAWLESLSSGLMTGVAEFIGDRRPLGIGVAKVGH